MKVFLVRPLFIKTQRTQGSTPPVTQGLALFHQVWKYGVFISLRNHLCAVQLLREASQDIWTVCDAGFFFVGEKLVLERMRNQPVGRSAQTSGSSLSLIASFKTSSDKIGNKLPRLTSESPVGLVLPWVECLWSSTRWTHENTVKGTGKDFVIRQENREQRQKLTFLN